MSVNNPREGTYEAGIAERFLLESTVRDMVGELTTYDLMMVRDLMARLIAGRAHG